MDKIKLIAELRRDEGEVLKVYADHLGWLTVGVGHLVDARKGANPAPFGVPLRIGDTITAAQSETLLQADIAAKEAELDKAIPWWRKLTDARQRVLLNMAFNLGTKGLLGFETTLRLIQAGSYLAASRAMLQSAWASQVKGRATRLSEMMAAG
jgi:lysozyme